MNAEAWSEPSWELAAVRQLSLRGLSAEDIVQRRRWMLWCMVQSLYFQPLVARTLQQAVTELPDDICQMVGAFVGFWPEFAVSASSKFPEPEYLYFQCPPWVPESFQYYRDLHLLRISTRYLNRTPPAHPGQKVLLCVRDMRAYMEEITLVPAAEQQWTFNGITINDDTPVLDPYW